MKNIIKSLLRERDEFPLNFLFSNNEEKTAGKSVWKSTLMEKLAETKML